MRHRIKKIPTLSNKSHHLLHSDKSIYTYFYKGKVKVGSLGKHILYSPGIPLLGGAALLLVLGMLLCPNTKVDSSKVYAEETTTINEASPQLDLPDSGVTLSIDTAMDNNTITKPVSSAGGAQYISVNFTVGANNVNRYQVFVQADSTILSGSSPNNPDIITSIAGATAASGIEAMQWGYAVSKGHDVNPATMTYNAIQSTIGTAADTVKKTDGSQLTNVTQPYTLAFAANLKDAKADHYKSNITLSVATDAKEVVTLSSLETMQDMTWRVCDAALVGDTARVKDARDGKYYWIAKLADENCWMTQNLALDLNGIALTSTDSDIPELVESWKSTTGASAIWSTTGGNDVKYYNPGNYVYTQPTNASNSCGDNKGLANCTTTQGKGWYKVDSLTASTDPNFYKNHQDQVVANGEYDTHFLSGNYYSWMAATASNTTASGDVNQSICPKGWRLPFSNTNTTEKSFGYLLGKYGVQSSLTSGQYDIRLAPLYFVYSGIVYSGKLINAGSFGDYWSSTAQSATEAYSLTISSSNVHPSSFNHRYAGDPVRCVAR